MLRHLLHTTHKLILRQENRQRVRSRSLASHRITQLILRTRQQSLEGFSESLFLLVGIVIFLGFLLLNKVLNRIAVYAYKAQFLVLLLRLTHGMYIQFAIHQQHVIALRLGTFDIGIVRIRIMGIERHQVTVLIGLIILDLRLIILQRRILTFDILEKCKTYRTLVELLIAQHTELDEEFDIVPFLLKIFAVVLVHLRQFIRHFLGDMTGDLLHVIVALQIGAADIKRNIRTVYHTVQQGQVLRNDILHLVRHEDLIAIELNLIAVHIQVGFDSREVQNTRQMERIIDIEMDMEQRFIELHRIQLVVEGLVVLFLQVCGFSGPGGIGIVDDILIIELYFLTVFPLFLLAKSYLYRQELTVFLQESFYRCVLEILFKLAVDMQHDIRSALGLNGLIHRIFGFARTGPMNRLRVFFITQGEDLYPIRYHKGRIEAQAEVTDDGFRLVLVLIQKLLRTGESDLVNVLIHFLFRHADTVIRNG